MTSIRNKKPFNRLQASGSSITPIYHDMTPINPRNKFDPLQSSGSSLVASTSLMNWVNPKEATDSEGSLSSGYGGYYCDNGVNIAILALTLAGLAAMFYVLYTKITMLVGRKRRSAGEYNSPVKELPYTYTYNIDDIINEIYWGTERVHKTYSYLYKSSYVDITYFYTSTNLNSKVSKRTFWLFVEKLFFIS